MVFDARTGHPVSLNREAKRIVGGLGLPGRSPEQLLEVLSWHRADGREISMATSPLPEALRSATTVRAEEIVLFSLATDVNAIPRISNAGDGAFGLDAKYGVTQNLTADFTYNTDFAQVEVDEQQVNLTRFSLFFPEKREFFLEGQGIFDFGRSAGGRGGPGGGRGGGGFFGGGGDVPTVFFSRRIGLEQDQTVPILGGGRLTGREGRFSIGALNIQTDDATGANAVATNFTVVRVKRDILRRSRIGGIFTGRSVSTVGDGTNQAYGLDAAFSFYDNVNFNGYYARTQTPGLDGDDASYQAAFSYDGDLYGFQLDHLLVGDHFNPEVGFLRRDDFRRTFTSAQYSPRPASIRAVRQFTVRASLDYIENGAGQVETRIAQARFDTELENSDRFSFDVQRNYELLVQPFAIASDVTIPVGGYDFADVFASYSTGGAAQVLGHLLHPARRVLQREHHGLRLPARPDRDHAAVLFRAEYLDQPDRPPRRAVHGGTDAEPRDVHVDAADVRRGPAAIQLRRRFAQHDRPTTLGVSARQRALRGLQRPARHIAAGHAVPREPRLHRQGHAAVPILTRRGYAIHGRRRVVPLGGALRLCSRSPCIAPGFLDSGLTVFRS